MPKSNQSQRERDICIVVPTFRRPKGLRIAIESLFVQDMMSEDVRILVVDNNPEPIEKPRIERLSKQFNHPIEYVHEPNAGVSNARNAAMKTAINSRYIAFLDDDMCVSPKWLSSLLYTSKSFRAGLVFGPTYAVMPHKDDPSNIYMEPFFERVVDKGNDDYIDETLGTGGCLIDLDFCKLPSPPFNPDLNERGGEDDIFFDHLKRTGTRVAWSIQAVSYELVPASRATPQYIWKRNFGYGQGPTRIHANRGLKGFPKIIYFMTAGTAQLLMYTPLLAVQTILRRPAKTKYLALTARALGKVFWLENFSPRLYGASMPDIPVEDDTLSRSPSTDDATLPVTDSASPVMRKSG